MSEKAREPIKLILRLYVQPAARKYIASQYPERAHTARRGLAKRDTIAMYIQGRLDRLTTLVPFWDDEPRRSEVEQEECRLAVEELRKLGWPDDKIAGWLLLQQARLEAFRTLARKKPA